MNFAINLRTGGYVRFPDFADLKIAHKIRRSADMVIMWVTQSQIINALEAFALEEWRNR